jgi:hypothetical protein
MRIQLLSLATVFLIGCQQTGSESEDLSAHQSGTNATLDVTANVDVSPLFCASPNLGARRPHFECEAQLDVDDDSDSDSDRNHRRRPNVVIDASVDDVSFVAIELSVKARKRGGGWHHIATDSIVIDPIFAMRGLSLESLHLGTGEVRTGRYDRVKISVEGVGVHYVDPSRAADSFHPNVQASRCINLNLTAAGASVGVDLDFTVRFADDPNSEQIAFFFDH